MNSYRVAIFCFFFAILIFSSWSVNAASVYVQGSVAPADQEQSVDGYNADSTNPYILGDGNKMAEVESASEASPHISGSGRFEKVKELDRENGFGQYGEITEDFGRRHISKKDKLRSAGQTPIGTFVGEKQYIQHSKEEVVSSMRDVGRSTFSFVFYRDDFNYNSANNAFDYTYRYEGGAGTESSDFSGILRFTGHRIYYQKFVRLGWGVGAGVGYNGGNGFFDKEIADSGQSNTHFNLWTFPLDISFSMELPVASFAKLGFYAGPSAIGVLQSRDDFDNEDSRKRMRDYGYGYFAAAKMHISLSGLSSSSSHEMFGSYSITRYYLTLEARTQSYGGFTAADISIDGVSFGAGLNFEYF